MDEIAGVVATVCVVVVAIALTLITLCLRVSANDHARIARDQAVKTACINNGGNMIAGNCIRLGN